MAVILFLSADAGHIHAVGAPLESCGHRVVGFQDPESALGHAAEQEPELVVAELALSGTTGLAFRAAYLERFPNRQTPMALLADGPQSDQIAAALAAGVDEVLPLPVEPALLVVRIDALLRRGRRGLRAWFRGDLRRLAPLDVLRFCEHSGLTGQARFSTPRGAAEVRFQGGQMCLDDGGADRVSELMDADCGTFVIESRPISFEAIDGVRRLSTAPPPAALAVVPMGCLSAVEAGGRLFQLQTEYERAPMDRIVSVAILDGRVVEKRARRPPSGIGEQRLGSLMQEQHAELQEGLRERITAFASRRGGQPQPVRVRAPSQPAGEAPRGASAPGPIGQVAAPAVPDLQGVAAQQGHALGERRRGFGGRTGRCDGHVATTRSPATRSRIARSSRPFQRLSAAAKALSPCTMSRAIPRASSTVVRGVLAVGPGAAPRALGARCRGCGLAASGGRRVRASPCIGSPETEGQCPSLERSGKPPWGDGDAPGRCNVPLVTHLYDTPGSATLAAGSEDEMVLRDLLLSGQLGAVFVVADTKNLRRSLALALQIADFGLPMVLALNMLDEAEALGIEVDDAELARSLGVPVGRTVAPDGRGVRRLAELLLDAGVPGSRVRLPDPVEHALTRLDGLLANPHVASRGLGILLLSGDSAAQSWVSEHLGGQALAAVDAVVAQAQSHFSTPLAVLIADGFHTEAARLADRVLTHSARVPALLARFGMLCQRPLPGAVIALGVLVAAYFWVGVFGAQLLVDRLSLPVLDRYVVPWCERLVAPIPWTLVRDAIMHPSFGLLPAGLFLAIGIVLPVLLCFYLLQAVIEDSGYSPRLAVLFDRILRRLGLNGQALIERGRITYIKPKDHARLHRLTCFGLTPGTVVEVHQCSPAFCIRFEGTELALDHDVAEDIYLVRMPS
ncbi:MAG: FeoA domain-containing protein [Deltaproteobacteria bacterium]|nr:FeoA domain-containing protein [Deltaproteobacteria bacterium]